MTDVTRIPAVSLAAGAISCWRCGCRCASASKYASTQQGQRVRVRTRSTRTAGGVDAETNGVSGMAAG